MELIPQGDEVIKNIQFVNLPPPLKLTYLRLFGFDVDKEGYISLNGERHKCPYTNEYIKFEEASILPGSTVVMKTSVFTLSSYISDHLVGDSENAAGTDL